MDSNTPPATAALRRLMRIALGVAAFVASAYGTHRLRNGLADAGWLGEAHSYPGSTEMPFTVYREDSTFCLAAMLLGAALVQAEHWLKPRRRFMLLAAVRGVGFGIMLGAALRAAHS